MKIIIFSAGFFPGKKCGGPPVSVDNFCSLLSEYDCYIVAHDHDMGETKRYEGIKDGWNDRGNTKVMYLSDSKFSSKAKISELVKELKPDWLYFQSLFQPCVFPGLMVAKEKTINVLLAPRGELCKGAFKKKYKKIPYIIFLRTMGLFKSVHFQSTSEEEKEAIHNILGVEYNHIHDLTNIPSIPKQDYKYNNKFAGSAKLIYLSRIHPKKNLAFALKCLNDIKGNVDFDIYGPKEDSGYWNRCLEIMQTLPDNIHVRYCGLVEHENVHETFSKYDAFLFPTYSENYGHVIAESLAVGTPAIISDQTPWKSLELYEAGYSIKLEDVGAFETAIQTIVDKDEFSMNETREKTKKFFSEKMKLDEMKNNYEDVFKMK